MLNTLRKRIKYLLAPESAARMRKRMKYEVRRFTQNNMRRNWIVQAEEKL